MRDDSSYKNLFEFIELRKAEIGTIITLLVALISAYEFFKKYPISVIIPCIAIILLVILIYIILKKEPSEHKLVGPTGGELPFLKRPSAFSQSIRHLALFGIIAIVIFFAIITRQKIRDIIISSDKTIILIAYFDGPEQSKYRLTETIYEKLKKDLNGNAEVQVLQDTITIAKGAKYARNKGKKQNASMILWGWYSKTEAQVVVHTHFEVLKSSYLQSDIEIPKLQDDVAKLESFEIQTKLADQAKSIVLVALGVLRFEKQDYMGAIILFNDALTKKDVLENMLAPAPIYFYRATAYHKRNKLDSAKVDYDHAIKEDSSLAEAYNNRGIVFKNEGKLDSAKTNYDQAIQLKPDFAAAFFNRSQIYYSQNDIVRARQDLQKAGELDSKYERFIASIPPTSTITETGDIISESPIKLETKSDAKTTNHRENTEAEYVLDNDSTTYYNSVLKRNPKDANAYYKRGISYYKKDDFDRAIADFNNAIKLRSNHAETYYQLGLAHHAKKDFDKAIFNYEKAIQFGYNKADVYYQSGLAYHEIYNYDRAITQYTQATKKQLKSIKIYYQRGLAYYAIKRYDQAIADFDQAISFDSKSVDAYFRRGMAYYFKHALDSAIVDYTNIITLKPDYADAYNQRGIAHYDQGKYNDAISDYNQAVALKPSWGEAYYNLGNVYHKQSVYDSAIVKYSEAIKYNPDYSEAYNNRGAAYSKKHDYKNAIISYDQAIQLNPDHALYYNNRGNAYFNIREYERAIADYDQAVKFDPEYAEAYSNRGATYKAIGNKERAKADFKKAQELTNVKITRR